MPNVFWIDVVTLVQSIAGPGTYQVKPRGEKFRVLVNTRSDQHISLVEPSDIRRAKAMLGLAGFKEGEYKTTP